MKLSFSTGSSLLPVSDRHQTFWINNKSVHEVVIPFPEKCIDELDALTGYLTCDNIFNVCPDKLTACAGFAVEMRKILFDGVGMAVIDRLPVERYTIEQCRLIAGVMANLISPLMAQDVNGTYLYDVIDTTAEKSADMNRKVFKRRSKTNVSQPFHTDGPWFDVPPHLVGLFCISPAARGGLSQVASLNTALEQVRLEGFDPSICEQLVAWNKMGEHKATEKPVRHLPIVERARFGTIMRHYADYVRTGFKLSDSDTPGSVDNLLTRLDQALKEQACTPFKLEAGQFQYVNNWTLAHARAGFSDEPESNSGRHLVRLWNQSPLSVPRISTSIESGSLEPELVH